MVGNLQLQIYGRCIKYLDRLKTAVKYTTIQCLTGCHTVSILRTVIKINVPGIENGPNYLIQAILLFGLAGRKKQSSLESKAIEFAVLYSKALIPKRLSIYTEKNAHEIRAIIPGH
ncbi:Uncharacterized protein FKW44_016762, partial [Caligus rogercresseyi]